MKLLYFAININVHGGLAKIVIDKINWLADHGYEVTLCNIENKVIKPAYYLDPRVKLISGNIDTESAKGWHRLSLIIKSIKQIKEIIKQEQPDLIVNAHCPIVTWILPFLQVKKDKSKIKIITEIHQTRLGLAKFDEYAIESPFLRWAHRWSTRCIYSLYDRFVVLTSHDKNDWNTRNCVVIPNYTSIDAKSFENQEKEHQILMMARLMPEKRIDYLIKAWSKISKEFPDWRVKVLGEGSMREFLEEGISILGLRKSFLMPGAVNSVESELAKSAIVCLTSEYEDFPISIIEAMTFGVPTVTFEFEGINEIIEDGVEGFIVPKANVSLFASKLKELILSAELREEMGCRAKNNVKRFDKEVIMNSWCNLFAEL